LTGVRVFITGMGLVTPAGSGINRTRDVIRRGEKTIRPLSLFPVDEKNRLPVGEIMDFVETGGLPRTHQLALTAAKEAMAHANQIPDAVVLGVTTGGMLTTEEGLKRGDVNPGTYQYHSPDSVTEAVARAVGCHGPLITLPTACSSGAVAIKAALEMLRAGMARTVLAGGADSLSRLTYHGFRSLRLIDPQAARPFDKNRQGMSVAEGAALLVLTASEEVPDHAIAEILGGGLSCDAHHPSAPHPDGAGALQAMAAAIHDAHIRPEEIDYVNLHGTGTVDNDLSEAKALNAFFPGKKPLMSSIKGAFGHSLGASGAAEAVVCALSVSENLIPANVGCTVPDPDLGIKPLTRPEETTLVRTVLSNSFGFGGNNAAIVIGAPDRAQAAMHGGRGDPCHLKVLKTACLTGAGNTEMSMRAIWEGRGCKGMVPDKILTEGLSARAVRRLKRLPRLVLSLASAAQSGSHLPKGPSAVFFGTGWGALSETYDFLTSLFGSEEQFPSPIDFVGSVHNGPAGQAAIYLKATGSNITATGGDYSFEQALMLAGVLAKDVDGPLLVIGSDEWHKTLTPLLDRSARIDTVASDGGGALCLGQSESVPGLKTGVLFYEIGEHNPSVMPSLMDRLSHGKSIQEKYEVIFVGIPAACRNRGQEQLATFLSMSGFEGPVIDYRNITGEFASASAVASVLAIGCLERGGLPGNLWRGKSVPLNEKGILLLGLGDRVTAVEVIY